MRKIYLISVLFVAVASTTAFAQPSKYGTDSIKCLGSLSVMSEFAKMGLYDEAYDSWKYCFSACPAASKNIYVIGANILKSKIENNPGTSANNYIDTLMLLYDRRIEYFGQEGYVLGRKGVDLLKYRPSEQVSAYELLRRSVAIERENVEVAVLGNLMQVTAVMYRNKHIPASEVVENYFLIIGYILDNQTISSEQQQIVIESINNIFIQSGAASCAVLEESLLPLISEKSNDIGLLKSIMSLVSKTGCKESGINLTVSELLYNADPSSEMAIYVANAFLNSQNYTKATEYYGKAILLEEDATIKAGIYCQMSLVAQQQNDLISARDLAMKALDIKPDMGEAFIAIGLAYAASGDLCSENTFESGVIYWAAVDKFIKAKTVDPEVTEKADELIQHYTQYFPDNETAFFYGYVDGNEYMVGCWINEKTVFRTKKMQ